MISAAHVALTSHFLAARHFSIGHGGSRQARKHRRSDPQKQQEHEYGTPHHLQTNRNAFFAFAQRVRFGKL